VKRDRRQGKGINGEGKGRTGQGGDRMSRVGREGEVREAGGIRKGNEDKGRGGRGEKERRWKGKSKMREDGRDEGNEMRK